MPAAPGGSAGRGTGRPSTTRATFDKVDIEYIVSVLAGTSLPWGGFQVANVLAQANPRHTPTSYQSFIRNNLDQRINLRRLARLRVERLEMQPSAPSLSQPARPLEHDQGQTQVQTAAQGPTHIAQIPLSSALSSHPQQMPSSLQSGAPAKEGIKPVEAARDAVDEAPGPPEARSVAPQAETPSRSTDKGILRGPSEGLSDDQRNTRDLSGSSIAGQPRAGSPTEGRGVLPDLLLDDELQNHLALMLTTLISDEAVSEHIPPTLTQDPLPGGTPPLPPLDPPEDFFHQLAASVQDGPSAERWKQHYLRAAGPYTALALHLRTLDAIAPNSTSDRAEHSAEENSSPSDNEGDEGQQEQESQFQPPAPSTEDISRDSAGDRGKAGSVTPNGSGTTADDVVTALEQLPPTSAAEQALPSARAHNTATNHPTLDPDEPHERTHDAAVSRTSTPPYVPAQPGAPTGNTPWSHRRRPTRHVTESLTDGPSQDGRSGQRPDRRPEQTLPGDKGQKAGMPSTTSPLTSRKPPLDTDSRSKTLGLWGRASPLPFHFPDRSREQRIMETGPHAEPGKETELLCPAHNDASQLDEETNDDEESNDEAREESEFAFSGNSSPLSDPEDLNAPLSWLPGRMTLTQHRQLRRHSSQSRENTSPTHPSDSMGDSHGHDMSRPIASDSTSSEGSIPGSESAAGSNQDMGLRPYQHDQNHGQQDSQAQTQTQTQMPIGPRRRKGYVFKGAIPPLRTRRRLPGGKAAWPRHSRFLKSDQQASQINKSDSEPGAGLDTGSEAGSGSKSGSNSDSGTDPDSHSNLDSDSDSESGADSISKSGFDAESGRTSVSASGPRSRPGTALALAAESGSESTSRTGNLHPSARQTRPTRSPSLNVSSGPSYSDEDADRANAGLNSGSGSASSSLPGADVESGSSTGSGTQATWFSRGEQPSHGSLKPKNTNNTSVPAKHVPDPQHSVQPFEPLSPPQVTTRVEQKRGSESASETGDAAQNESARETQEETPEEEEWSLPPVPQIVDTLEAFASIPLRPLPDNRLRFGSAEIANAQSTRSRGEYDRDEPQPPEDRETARTAHFVARGKKRRASDDTSTRAVSSTPGDEEDEKEEDAREGAFAAPPYKKFRVGNQEDGTASANGISNRNPSYDRTDRLFKRAPRAPHQELARPSSIPAPIQHPENTSSKPPGLSSSVARKSRIFTARSQALPRSRSEFSAGTSVARHRSSSSAAYPAIGGPNTSFRLATTRWSGRERLSLRESFQRQVRALRQDYGLAQSNVAYWLGPDVSVRFAREQIETLFREALLQVPHLRRSQLEQAFASLRGDPVAFQHLLEQEVLDCSVHDDLVPSELNPSEGN